MLTHGDGFVFVYLVAATEMRLGRVLVTSGHSASRVTCRVSRDPAHRTLSILSPECHIDIGTIVRKLTDNNLNIYHSQLILSSNIYAFKIQTLFEEV